MLPTLSLIDCLGKLGATAKVRRSPAKRTKLVSLETPSLPPKRREVRTSGSNSQTTVSYKHHLKPKVRFFSKTPTLPNEFCSFHWASANFCDGSLYSSTDLELQLSAQARGTFWNVYNHSFTFSMFQMSVIRIAQACRQRHTGGVIANMKRRKTRDGS